MHVELYCMEMYGNCNKSGVGVVWQTRVRGMGVGWGRYSTSNHIREIHVLVVW